MRKGLRMARLSGDALGLGRGQGDWLLPVLVAGMSFLAALALVGALALGSVTASWQRDTASALTIQIPDAAQAGAELTLLQSDAAVKDPALLSAVQVGALLSPWLGGGGLPPGITLPAIITATLREPMALPALTTKLAQLSPGSTISAGAAWGANVATFCTGLQGCAVTLLGIVTLVAAAIIALATRAGLALRRESVEIIHALGAFDGDIAGRFAGRAMRRAALGGLIGTICAVPVSAWLHALVSPLTPAPGLTSFPDISAVFWICLAALPAASAIIGYLSAQITVRGWLRQLP